LSLKKYSILALILLNVLKCYAQDSIQIKNAIAPYVHLHYGFVMPSAKDVEYLGKSHTQALEFGIEIKTRGAKYWHEAYNFPTFGFTCMAFNLNNPTLGNFIIAVPYQSLNLIKPSKIELKFRIGVGIGYISNKFDRIDNHRNRVISANIGGVMHGGLEFGYNLNKNGKIISKLYITHMSNGAYSMPNFGINLPTLSIGYSHFINERNEIRIENRVIPKFKKFSFDFSSSVGFKENYPTDGERFRAFRISAYGILRTNYKNGWIIGFDGFNDLSLKDIQKRHSNSDFDTKRVGFLTGHELHIGKFSLVTSLGTYIYKPFKRDSLFYQRYGFKYYFTENIYLGVFLKTHLGVADNIEWTLGTRF
jgi:hypothetical protein